MKAEEYLKENRFQSMEYSGYDVCYSDALEAVNMARKEERERAYNALESALAGFTTNCAKLILDEFKAELEAKK